MCAKIQFEPIGFITHSTIVIKQFKSETDKIINFVVGTVENAFLTFSTDLQNIYIIGGGDFPTFTTADFVLTLYYL